jgi:hypothetical protein
MSSRENNSDILRTSVNRFATTSRTRFVTRLHQKSRHYPLVWDDQSLAQNAIAVEDSLTYGI